MQLRARLESHFLIVGFTRVHTFVTWDSHELTHNLTGSHAQTFVLDWKRHTHKGHTTRQQTATWAHTAGHKRDGHRMCAHLSFVGFTCVHTVCAMQRIHKHNKVGCALTESLIRGPRPLPLPALPHTIDSLQSVHTAIAPAVAEVGARPGPAALGRPGRRVRVPLDGHTALRGQALLLTGVEGHGAPPAPAVEGGLVHPLPVRRGLGVVGGRFGGGGVALRLGVRNPVDCGRCTGTGETPFVRLCPRPPPPPPPPPPPNSHSLIFFRRQST